MDNEIKGIVIVDKPAKVSSARVVSRIKKIFGARKAGHAGTLDPMATGVLVCCINDATRLARFLLTGEKAYEAVLHLGIETDTQDASGTIIATTEVTGLSEENVESIFRRFTGPIQQKPPIYSALKYRGVPLYKLARKGIPIQKPSRQVVINNMCIQRFALPEVVFAVSCSSGTYIRTLCADIGAALGCGGHLKALRRTESSGFTLQEAVSLEDLVKQQASGTLRSQVISMSEALKGMTEHRVDDALAEKIRQGCLLTQKDIQPKTGIHPDGFIKVVGENHELVAVLRQNEIQDRLTYCCVFQK